MSSLEPSAADTSPHTDRIVRELDVYVCNGALGAGTQMYLLQCPLRPPWRPYHEGGLQKVRLKPKVKKLSCEAPLETAGRNYNTNVEPSRKVKTLGLQSSRVDMRVQLAGGFVEENRLLLFPIDEVLQLRPSLTYLDKEKEATKKAGAAAEEDKAAEEEKAAALMPLTVQVKRRETEHQQAARLRSYAYLQQQEEQDTWLDLRYHDENSEMAAKVWAQLANVDDVQDVRHTMSRQQYVEAIMPGAASLDQPPQEMDFGGNAGLIDLGQPSSFATRSAMEATAAARRGVHTASAGWADGPSGGGGGARAAASAGGSWAGRPAAAAGPAAVAVEQLPADVMAALPVAVAGALKWAPVLSLEQIRGYLEKLDSPAKPAAAVSDASLHQALLAAGTVVCIRRCYMHKSLGNPTLDPLRDIVLELLAEKEQLKRSDIIEAAKQKGIQVSDTLYSKVVKEICISRGGAWSLKMP